MVTPYCGQCKQAITIGRVLEYKRANCCESCYVRLEGDLPPSDDQLAIDEQERRAAELLERRRREASRRAREGPRPQKKEYKVLTQMDGFFSGVFTPERIEAAVNLYASQGWTVVSMTGVEFPGMLTSNHQLIVLFERDFIQTT